MIRAMPSKASNVLFLFVVAIVGSAMGANVTNITSESMLTTICQSVTPTIVANATSFSEINIGQFCDLLNKNSAECIFCDSCNSTSGPSTGPNTTNEYELCPAPTRTVVNNSTATKTVYYNYNITSPCFSKIESIVPTTKGCNFNISTSNGTETLGPYSFETAPRVELGPKCLVNPDNSTNVLCYSNNSTNGTECTPLEVSILSKDVWQYLLVSSRSNSTGSNETTLGDPSRRHLRTRPHNGGLFETASEQEAKQLTEQKIIQSSTNNTGVGKSKGQKPETLYFVVYPQGNGTDDNVTVNKTVLGRKLVVDEEAEEVGPQELKAFVENQCEALRLDESIWPLPKEFTKGDETRIISSDISFQSDQPSPTLSEAFGRYKGIMFPFPSSSGGDVIGKNTMITSIVASVEDWSEEHPQIDTAEDYTLVVPSGSSKQVSNIHIQATTIYGALRAMDTLTQLVQYDADSDAYVIKSSPWRITDEPRFSHRGILIDTARHFLPLPHIKHVLDSMSYAKLNVLHWHLTDSQSFPLMLESYPELASKGSFSKAERYTKRDVAHIVEYARLRGIRVIVEFDVPGHAESWCDGMPELCPSLDCKGPLDVSNEKTFEVIGSILKELTSNDSSNPLLPEKMIHLGGDEVDLMCWSQSAPISKWLADNGMTRLDGHKYFVDRVSSIAKSTGLRPIQWVEVYEEFGSELDKDTIVHVWKDKQTLAEVVSAGYDAILSDQKNMYLDHLDMQWFDMYNDEPFEGIDDPKMQKKILGGQAQAWGETIDGSNLLNTIWPRAAALAERMWSPSAVASTNCALPRLQDFRQLLLARGIPAAPVTNAYARTEPRGPGSTHL